MTQNDKNVKIDYSKIKDYDAKQLQDAIVKKELTLPPMSEKADREKFLKFASTKPNSTEREAILKDILPVEKKESGEIPDSTIKKPEEKKIDDSSQVKSENKSGESPDTKTDNDYSFFIKENERLKDEIKRHRETNGRLGKEASDYKKKVDELFSEMEKIKSKDKESSVVKKTKPSIPKKPIPPDPEKYEDGFLSDDYKRDFKLYSQNTEKYNKDLDKYEEGLEKYFESLKPSGFDDLKRDIEELKPRVEKAFEIGMSVTAKEQQSYISKSWDDMWNEASSVQKKLGLETKHPIKLISDYAYIVANKDSVDQKGNKVYTQEDVYSAQNFIDRLSPEEKSNYDKITKVVQSYFSFDDGIPKKRYEGISPELALNAAIDYARNKMDLNLDLLKPVEFTEQERLKELSKRQQEDLKKATPMGSSSIGSNDSKLENNNSLEEKVTRLSHLAELARSNPNKFWKDPTFKESREEYEILKRELMASASRKK